MRKRRGYLSRSLVDLVSRGDERGGKAESAERNHLEGERARVGVACVRRKDGTEVSTIDCCVGPATPLASPRASLYAAGAGKGCCSGRFGAGFARCRRAADTRTY